MLQKCKTEKGNVSLCYGRAFPCFVIVMDIERIMRNAQNIKEAGLMYF